MDHPPFQIIHQLNSELDMKEAQTSSEVQQDLSVRHLPGHPRIALVNSDQLCNFIIKDLDLLDLEEMAPRLWMLSMQSSANISPLHRQTVKGRTVIVTEDPRLHLVWYYDRIFIKPLPKFLLSAVFWSKYLIAESSPLGPARETIQRAALGYLRTYFYLIRHESDFRIAADEKLRLVPENITWQQFCAFSESFDSISDNDVSERYSYGEIRLSRLNFYCKLFLYKSTFQRVDAQYGAYFARLYGPILFAWATFSVVLNAMQLELTAEQLQSSDQWVSFWSVCRWCSILLLIVVTGLSMLLVLIFMLKFVKEWVYALKDRRRKRTAGNLKNAQR